MASAPFRCRSVVAFGAGILAMFGAMAATAASTIIPGSGFTGPTPQPPAVGTGFGADATAIARWDVVPYQTFDDVFEIGVIAFHVNGIDRVEFSAEGGPWTPVPERSVNPRTGVLEFWAELDASLYADGPVEIRARVYPNRGVPRVLGNDIRNREVHIIGDNAMQLVANANGTFDATEVYVSTTGSDTTGNGTLAKPFLTVERAVDDARNGGNADGIVIYLLAGQYGDNQISIDNAPTQDRWVTISGAPGLTRDQVVAVYPKNVESTLHRFRNMTFEIPVGSGASMLFDGTKDRSVWLDNVHIDGAVRTNRVDIISASNIFMAYGTNLLLEDNVHGPTLQFLRHVTVRRIGGDAFTRSRLLINGVVEDVNRDLSGVPDAHPDIKQFGDQGFNNIVFGLQAHQEIRSQGIFATGFVEDFAAVNVHIDNRPSPHSLRVNNVNHMVLINVTAYDRVGSLDNSAHNVLFENCDFDPESEGSPEYGNIDQPDVIWREGGGAGFGDDFDEDPVEVGRSYLREEGQTFLLSIPDSANAPIQWTLNKTPLVDDARISGASGPVLNIQPLMLTDSGIYRVTYIDGDGFSEVYGPAYLTVVPAGALPAISPYGIVLTVIAIAAAALLVAVRRAGSHH